MSSFGIKTSLGIKTTPIGYQDIERIATKLRTLLKISNGTFPADKLERIVEILYGEKCLFGVRDMPEEGITLLNGSAIYLSTSTYDNLINQDTRARFTAMHELAHRILHCNGMSNLAHCRTGEIIKTYCNPEWQADALAGAILCPASEITSNITAKDIAEKYLVSMQCAETRLSVIRKYFMKS